MRSRQQSSFHRSVTALFLAVLAHVLTATAMWLSGALTDLLPTSMPTLVQSAASTQSPPEEPMQIEQLMAELDKPPEQTPAEAQREKEVKERDPSGQVVDIARPTIEQRPDDAKFLAEYDSTVNKEQKGAVGRDKAGAPLPSMPTPPVGPTSKKPVPALPALPQPPSQTAAALAMRGPIGTKVPGPSAGGEEVSTIGPDGTMPHTTGQGEVRPPEQPGAGAQPGGFPKLNLAPSQSTLQQALGEGAGSSDYMDLDEGPSTALNAKAWKYAAFFNRMKALVRDEWHPDELLSRHDPSGKIYGGQDRVTVLKVALRLDGRVKDIEVGKGSEIEFLDDEAQSAFRRAQPFENPPAGLAGPDGLIKFKFAFVVQLGGRTTFRVYRN